MKKKIFVPINEEVQESNTEQQTLNESANTDVPSIEELRDGIDLLTLIRDGFVKYKSMRVGMDQTDDGHICVYIVDPLREVDANVCLVGNGYEDCERALNAAIGNIIEKIYKEEGLDINESLKNEILGYGGAALLGLGALGLTTHDALNTKPDTYTISKEQMEENEKKAEESKKERTFYVKHAEELAHSDPSTDGFVFDKANLPDGGGVLSVMVDIPYMRNRSREDQYARRRIYRYYVNDEILRNYNIGDYINYTDLGELVY